MSSPQARRFKPYSGKFDENSIRTVTLKKTHRVLSFFGLKHDIATALSPSGWAAAATPTEVRLYNLEAGQEEEDLVFVSVPLNLENDDKVRAVALSHDVLAILTRRRLVIYSSYKNPEALKAPPYTWNLDCKPKSLGIAQRGVFGADSAVFVWIAVGACAYNGVEMYSCLYKDAAWKYQDTKLSLDCPGNMGWIKLINFSTDRWGQGDGCLILGLAESDVVYCWNVTQKGVKLTKVSSWRLNVRPKTYDPSSRGTITSASILISPLGDPFVFCTTNRTGSKLPPNFIARVELSESDIREPSENYRTFKDFGRDALHGIVSRNGHFLVAFEEHKMHLLSLQASYQTPDDSGPWLCSLGMPQVCKCALEGPVISGSITESSERLRITAIDGGGHAVVVEVTAGEMPAPDPPIVRIQLPPQVQQQASEKDNT